MKKTLVQLITSLTVLLSVCGANAKTVSLNELTNSVQSIYQDDIQKNYGLKLEIKLNHNQPYYFGGSSVENGDFRIDIGAQLFRLKGMSLDATAFLLCHEIGHLLGGSPKKQTNLWSSTEGQSDYFAATGCLRKIFNVHPAASTEKQNSSIQKICSAQSINPKEVAVCSRIVFAGLDLMNAIYIFMDVPQMIKPQLSTSAPDLKAGEELNYPTLQCRLDTIVAGAKLQERPACWYRKVN